MRQRGLARSELKPGTNATWLHYWTETGETPEDSPKPVGETPEDSPKPVGETPQGSRGDASRSIGETPGDSQKVKEGITEEGNTPPELRELRLYRDDQKLLKTWPELIESWRAAFPGLDIIGEIRKAHSWEVANPANRKKDRPKFLDAWLRRTAKEQPEPCGAKYDELERL